MQQQIDVIVKMTYQADSTLSRAEIVEQITDDLWRLADADSSAKVEMCTFILLGVKEEAEIYGNE